MKKMSKILAVVMAFAMVSSLAACGSGNDGKETKKSESKTAVSSTEVSSGDTSSKADSSEKVSSDNPLKGIYDKFVKDESYISIKSAYPNAKFEEKLSDDSISVKISGSDGMDGTYTFPAKDGYLNCEVAAEEYTAIGLFNMIVGSVGEYYGINSALFRGYLNGLDVNGIESKVYSSEVKEDGSGKVKIYYAEKPEMKELDQMYINEKALENFNNEIMQSFSTFVGSIAVNGTINRDKNTISFLFGEYGDKNTDLTYKSIVEIVKFFKPDGYEDFVKDYTELKTVSTDKYKVSTDTENQDIELIDGYTFMFVTFGSETAE